jgi:hypothetical protein
MRTALLLACTLVGGCALYTGPSNGDDGDDALPLPDAGFLPDAQRACPTPGTGEVSVCGNLYDVETGESVDPATVSIKFYDALAYANVGTAATELVPRSMETGADGRFEAQRMPSTSSGYLAVVVDNVDGDADDRAPTVLVMAAYSAQVVDGARAYTFRRYTNGTWTTALGLGDSTLAHHPWLYLYRTDHEPVAGVTVTTDTASAPTYVFDDANPESHHSPVAGNLTGTDGSLLVLWPSVGSSGTLTSSGGISECIWNTPRSDTSPSDVLYVTDVGFTCPI